MDSRNPLNPYGQSPSLVGFLNSQTFPYESYQSDIPPFSSQQTPLSSQQTPFHSQQTATPVATKEEVRPEGIKAAKAKRNTAKGKSVADYATIMEMKKADWEMKQADLERKERLSKLAILDTLLSKPGPLSEAEEACLAMGRYSYSQPSSSEAYPERSDSGESETEDLIRRDQAEIELQYEDKVVRLERLVEESLAKKKSSVTDRFEVVVGVMLVVVVVIGVVMALK
ncbi:hypothetical protein Bca4012_063127 [Brassica carinata]